MEQIEQLNINDIRAFEGQPFKVREDDAMAQLMASVAELGVLTPVVVRPHEDGGYEMVSGHRRLHACRALGMDTMPAVVREMDYDKAVICMVDSNLQREDILPSEKAFAYKMKLDAMKRQGQRTDLTSTPAVSKSRSDEILGKETGESREQIRRYIRLTNLVPDLLSMVDENKIALRPAVELSYLTETEQKGVLSAMEYAQQTPSAAQAKQMRKLSREGKCTDAAMEEILSQERKGDREKLTLNQDDLERYFPKSYTPQKMKDTIMTLLDRWAKQRAREMQR